MRKNSYGTSGFTALFEVIGLMKRFKLLNGKPIPNEPEKCDVQIRWEMCVLCQTEKSEALQCPNDTKRNDRGAGYKSLAESLREFGVEGQLPSWLCLLDIDDGRGIEEGLSINSAKWHKSCRNLYSKMKLERLKKRKSLPLVTDDSVVESLAFCPNVISDDTSQYFTRSSATISSNTAACCIFCDKCETHGPLHQVTTFDVDCRVLNCAYMLCKMQAFLPN